MNFILTRSTAVKVANIPLIETLNMFAIFQRKNFSVGKMTPILKEKINYLVVLHKGVLL